MSRKKAQKSVSQTTLFQLGFISLLLMEEERPLSIFEIQDMVRSFSKNPSPHSSIERIVKSIEQTISKAFSASDLGRMTDFYVNLLVVKDLSTRIRNLTWSNGHIPIIVTGQGINYAHTGKHEGQSTPVVEINKDIDEEGWSTLHNIVASGARLENRQRGVVAATSVTLDNVGLLLSPILLLGVGYEDTEKTFQLLSRDALDMWVSLQISKYQDAGMIPPEISKKEKLTLLCGLAAKKWADEEMSKESSQDSWIVPLVSYMSSRALRDPGQTTSGDKGTPEDFTKSDHFFDEAQVSTIKAALVRKKCILLKGPAGVGKTLLARLLAHQIANGDSSLVRAVQFHQSYSYEDFVRGFRPDKDGKLNIQNGVLIDFANIARSRSAQNHILIIDEINRGNIAKIFGEVLTLMEADKRNKGFSLCLQYKMSGEESFSLPENLLLIGIMNTTDKSIAGMDFALQRRFESFEIEPAFKTAGFQQYLLKRGASPELVQDLVSFFSKLNDEICEDPVLGSGMQLGHSFFCEGSAIDRSWIESVVRNQVRPIVQDYGGDQSYVDQIDAFLKSLARKLHAS